ncbi:hypothetical protein PMIN06_007710 [Paraphaeosphaeria minitans]
MPETLNQGEVNSHTDPSVAKQYDTDTPKEQQIKDLYSMIDGKKIGMLSTYRNGVGPIGRSMAIGKRIGPDILFLSNGHASKVSDLARNNECQVTFQDSKTQDWISLSGTAATVSNTDARIKDVWSPPIRAWFGDLGDGKHDGSADDPRMTLIEFRPKYVVYYLTQVGLLGYVKEVGVAAMTGKIADTGVLRELDEKDIEMARGMKE